MVINRPSGSLANNLLMNCRLPYLRKPGLLDTATKLTLSRSNPGQILFLCHFDAAMAQQYRNLINGKPRQEQLDRKGVTEHVRPAGFGSSIKVSEICDTKKFTEATLVPLNSASGLPFPLQKKYLGFAEGKLRNAEATTGGKGTGPSLTLAECLCGEADWLNPSRLPRPCSHSQRARPAAHSEILLCLLREIANSLGTCEGRSGSAFGTNRHLLEK
jgi:hypothetical protein